jgi:hypothetical protein
MSQKLKWGGVPDLPPPKNPVRDTLVVYGVLSLIIILVAWVTGGGVGKATIIAVLFFVVASGWTLWRFRVRARDAAKNEGEA